MKVKKVKKKKKIIKKKIKKAIKKKVLQKKIVKKQVVNRQVKEEHSLELRNQNKKEKVSLFSSFDKSVEATLNKQGIYWEESPVGLREFVTSPDHMNIPLGLSEKQYEPLEFLFGSDPKKILESQNTIAVEEWAKGSGKDTVAAIAFAYVIHILLCCSDPQKFVGLEIPGEPIDFINVAINKEQAASVFFTKFQQRVKRWEWLKARYPLRVSGRSLTGATTGKNKIDADNEVVITTTGILFPKMLRAFSGNSEEESQEGKNYLMFVMDEVGGYKTTKQHSPNKIFKVLQSSARTRFQSKWFGFILSYPRYKDDYIETMRKKAEKRLHWHSSKCTSWEVKPLRLFSGKWFEFDGIKIPLEFKEDFEDDPIDARTKHLCIPPDAVNPFIDDHEKIELAVKSKNKQMFEFYDYIKDGYVCKKVKLAPHVKNILATKFTLTIDLGVSQCGCAISVHHKEVDGVIDIIKQDMVTRWEPDPKKGLRVDFFNAVNVLLFIIKTLGKKQVRVFFDQWNSELMVNIFKKTKIDAKIYYLHYDNYHDFRERINTGRIELLDYAPQTKEIKGLSLIKGVKVDRPEGGTKDICDTIVGAIYILTGKYDEKVKNKKKKGHLLREEGDGIFINGNLDDEENPGMFIKHGEDEVISDNVSIWDNLQ